MRALFTRKAQFGQLFVTPASPLLHARRGHAGLQVLATGRRQLLHRWQGRIRGGRVYVPAATLPPFGPLKGHCRGYMQHVVKRMSQRLPKHPLPSSRTSSRKKNISSAGQRQTLQFNNFYRHKGHEKTLGGILAVNILVYLGWHVPALQPYWRNMFIWTNKSLQEGKYWLLVTPSFSHQNFGHLFGNMSLFLYLGKRLHMFLGRYSTTKSPQFCRCTINMLQATAHIFLSFDM